MNTLPYAEICHDGGVYHVSHGDFVSSPFHCPKCGRRDVWTDGEDGEWEFCATCGFEWQFEQGAYEHEVFNAARVRALRSAGPTAPVFRYSAPMDPEGCTCVVCRHDFETPLPQSVLATIAVAEEQQ